MVKTLCETAKTRSDFDVGLSTASVTVCSVAVEMGFAAVGAIVKLGGLKNEGDELSDGKQRIAGTGKTHIHLS
jgi:hypothetical protein